MIKAERFEWKQPTIREIKLFDKYISDQLSTNKKERLFRLPNYVHLYHLFYMADLCIRMKGSIVTDLTINGIKHK